LNLNEFDRFMKLLNVIVIVILLMIIISQTVEIVFCYLLFSLKYEIYILYNLKEYVNNNINPLIGGIFFDVLLHDVCHLIDDMTC
jgi:hypothetical protein